MVVYRVNLYLNGALVGDVRELAVGLTWTRKRTKVGADSIDFTLNDVLFNKWCEKRGMTINDLLKPYALECRIVRNGIPVVGGFLSTMPGYQPRVASADLKMKFDGYLNLLAGVYAYYENTKLPIGTVTGNLNAIIQNLITTANTRSANAGKGFGFTFGNFETLPSVTATFDIYKSIKDFICDRCDNTEGAGPFDLFFTPAKEVQLYADANFGQVITDWTAEYPATINKESATRISAPEVAGFASTIIAVGNGEVSADLNVSTALVDIEQDDDAVADYGYVEAILQRSDISREVNLRQAALTELYNLSSPQWQPQITLTGRQISPTPNGTKKIWIGDVITIENKADLTGQTSGQFRVDALKVAVSATNAETITPTLDARTSSAAAEMTSAVGITAREVTALKQAYTHGLGMIDFANETITQSVAPGSGHKVVVTFGPDDPWPPFCEVGISPQDDDVLVVDSEFDESARTYTVNFDTFDTKNLTITATSSAQITSLVVL